jgi:hypothetical protein
VYTDTNSLLQDLFAAGTDTTSKAMEWPIKNPKEMEKVQAEVRQVVAGQSERSNSGRCPDSKRP